MSSNQPQPFMNGSSVKWAQLWPIIVGIVALGGAVLGLHSIHPHENAVTKQEQRQFELRFTENRDQFEKRMVDTFDEIRRRLISIEAKLK